MSKFICPRCSAINPEGNYSGCHCCGYMSPQTITSFSDTANDGIVTNMHASTVERVFTKNEIDIAIDHAYSIIKDKGPDIEVIIELKRLLNIYLGF